MSEQCDHAATLTDRIHAAYGPWIHTTEPMTVCLTCWARIETEEEQ